jgi:hypothetical protein
MLTLLEYQLLNACADGCELFYFLFAAANYGGQVFPAPHREPVLRRADSGSWTVSVKPEEIAQSIVALTARNLLECWVLDPRRMITPVIEDFAVYSGYRCLTFDEHVAQFGYGPHEFCAAAPGLAEIQEPVYSDYDRKLGWPLG